MLRSIRQPFRLTLAAFCTLPLTLQVTAQQFDEHAIIQHVDDAVKARAENVLNYTVNEHYAVFRNKDEIHPVAEITVKTTFNKDSGKTFTPVSQSGSELIRTQVLGSILDNEKRLSLPENRPGALLNSSNYEMKPKQEPIDPNKPNQWLALTLTPRRRSPYLLEGTLWVDPTDFTIVKIEGTTSASASIFTGHSQITRQYAKFNGIPMAIHARAITNSFLFGETIIKIDYQGYDVQLRPTP